MPTKQLDPHLWNLEEVFKSVYNVPVYQRPYSWDKEEVNTLLDDIFEAYFSESKYEGYYTGNIIVYDRNQKINGLITKYEIIDGQQRITTFALILLSVYTISLSRKINKDDKTLGNVKGALWKFVNREYKRDLRAVSLNSIEKECFTALYNRCYDNPLDILEYCNKYTSASGFEKRVIDNFKWIYTRINNTIAIENKDDILDFADYLLQYIQFIAIESTCQPSKVFSMFESINGKGKRLEEIDLIKTYIFSKLNEDSYDTYLDKWGQLIIKTQDNLYDYLYNYIKAYLSFYRQNISIINFKSICRRELLNYFNVTNEAEALKLLLDDMLEKVDFYNMLYSAEAAYKLIRSNKFKFFYKIFTEISYKHPKALFLRTLIEFSEKKISKDDAVDIIVETTKFMMKFLTIGGRDSKDVITMFAGIMNEIYVSGAVTKATVINLIAAELLKQGVTNEKLKSDLKTIDAFEQNKRLTIALLSLYEATEKTETKLKISYDQAYTIINSYNSAFSLDHLLVQTPDQNSEEFKYYKDESKNKLVLKDGHDFPAELAVDGMDYDTFTRLILNKIGNLRIYYRDKNSTRQNNAIQLKECINFCTYKDIVQRGEDIINLLIDDCLPMPDVDISNIQTNSYKKLESALPKMEKLIEYQIIKPGDKLYITLFPDTSEATLVDSKYVDFNEQRMTLNEWGCKVTGWHSIRIYAYAAIVGEIETLHEKRLKYIETHNEGVN